MTQELKRQGVHVNHKRVLREENLVRRPKNRFVVTTNSDHRLPVYPNLAADMDITAPDQLRVSDLTYIRLGREFIYLAVVLDAYSRRCLGWSLLAGPEVGVCSFEALLFKAGNLDAFCPSSTPAPPPAAGLNKGRNRQSDPRPHQALLPPAYPARLSPAGA